MAQDIVGGLFGPQPWEIQQAQQQAVGQAADRFAAQSPFEKASGLLYRGGAGLTEAGAGMLGYQNPAVMQAQQRQQALQGLDISSPDSILAQAQQIQDPQTKMRLMMLAQELKDKEMKRRLEEAHAKYYEQGGAAGVVKPLTQTELSRVTRHGYDIAVKNGKTGPELAAFVNAYVDAVKSGKMPMPKEGAAPEPTSAVYGTDAAPLPISDQTKLSIDTSTLTQEQKDIMVKEAESRGDTTAADAIRQLPVVKPNPLTDVKTPAQLAAEKAKAVAEAKKGEPIPKEKLDFFAQQYLLGDTQWQVGIGRAAGGADFIKEVKLRSQELAKELGVTPEDIVANRQEITTRLKALNAFKSGKQGDTVRSFNVAIDHLDTLDELGKALKNNDTRSLNRISTFFEKEFGGAAPTNFDAVKSLVADEVVKAIVGGVTALGDRQKAQEDISRISSPEQMAGYIESVKKLMAGQLKGLKNQYEFGTKLKNFDTMLFPKTKTLLGVEAPATAAPAPAAAPAAAAAAAPVAPPKKTVSFGALK